jgi:hypothetical protein
MFDLKRFHKLGRTAATATMAQVPSGSKPFFPKTVAWWIEAIVLAISAVCLVCALALALGAWSPGSAEPAPSESAGSGGFQALSSDSFEGVISDSHCGAKHSAAIGQSAGDCTRACVHAGEKFVLIDREKTYVLDGDPYLLKKLAGERVRVSGKLNGTTISVSSAAEL